MLEKENYGTNKYQSTLKGQRRRRESVGSVLTETTFNSKEGINVTSKKYQSTCDWFEEKKQVGKIRKNSKANYPPATSTVSSFQTELISSQKLNQYRDEVMNKIRLSQLTNYNSLHPTAKVEFSPKVSKNSKTVYCPHFNSVSEKYELKMEVVMGSFEARKQKIDEEISKIKNRKRMSINEQFFSGNALQSEKTDESTPKFASTMKKPTKMSSQIKISKINRGPKWVEFMNVLGRQIELEQQLRTAKHMVQNSNKIEITFLLSQKHIITDLSILTLEAEEYDPFFKPLSLSPAQIVEKLVTSWRLCEQHWAKTLKNKFEPSVLEAIYRQLNGQKGTLTLKAFVRQLGILYQNQKHLRNRDLYRIFTRMYPFSEKQFISELGIKQ